MSTKIFVFERKSREEVVAASEEEARKTFWQSNEWELIDVREVPA